mmetsp:Transcript_10826/g.27788  ORF Transcript_10826/g.27788 Transcript_10826/m.27788 type:complete len:469 (+) Transcript_10826:407-1813(+)
MGNLCGGGEADKAPASKPAPKPAAAGAPKATPAAAPAAPAPKEFTCRDADGAMIKLADEALLAVYKPVNLLGSGGTGQSWLMVEKETNEYLAVKLIPRPIPTVLQPMMLREIEIQGQLGHGHLNLVNSSSAILTAQHLGIAMEYAAGQSLTKYVTDAFPKSGSGLFLKETEARYFFKQIISALEYCHNNNVAHRDLKLDNTLLDGSNPPYIKICDFGFAKSWGNDEEGNLFTQIGTPVYMSPEVITARENNLGYDARGNDIWSAGVLLFVMLLGSFPFDHEEHPDPNSSEAQQEVWKQQCAMHWSDMPSNEKGVSQLSIEVKDLLDKIFVVDSTKRIHLDEIKNHPWYKKALPAEYEKALRILEEEQAKLPPCPIANMDKVEADAKHKRLAKMVETAGASPNTPPPDALRGELGSGQPYIVRCDLGSKAAKLKAAEEAMMNPLGADSQLNPITEDDGEISTRGAANKV